MKLIDVPLDRIEPNPWQTRRELQPAHVAELAADIARNGLLHPPTARLRLDGEALDYKLYGGPAAALQDEPQAIVQLAVGHNRRAAYELLAYGPSHVWGHDMPDVEMPAPLGEDWDWIPDPGTYGHLPVRITTYSDEQMAAAAWAENSQRKDLSPLEEAQAIHRAIEDFGWTQAQAAEHFGLARTTIANKLRLLKLPQKILDKLHEGALSERASTALVPLYTQPEEVQTRMQDPPRTWMPSISKIEMRAMRGDSSSMLRRNVEQAIEGATRQMSGAHFPLDELLGVGQEDVRSPTCHECPLYLANGGDPRCGDPDCFRAKAAVWRQERLELAHEKLPLAFAPEDAPGWHLHTFDDGDQGYAYGRQILEQGCEKLCLAHLPDREREKHLHVEGMPDVHVCCHEGSSLCACLKELKKGAAESQAIRRFQEEVVDPAVQRVTEALDGGHRGAWIKVVQGLVYGVNARGREWPEVCRLVALKLVDNALPYKAHQRFEEERSDLLQWLADAGIPRREEDDPLDELERRLQRIQGWADRLHESWPTPDQIQGNLDNLQGLREEAEQVWEDLEAAGRAAPLMAQIMQLENLLEDLQPIVEHLPTLAVFYETMPQLMTVEPEAIRKVEIPEARGTLLNYALVLALYRDDLHRVDVLAELTRQIDDEGSAIDMDNLEPFLEEA